MRFPGFACAVGAALALALPAEAARPSWGVELGPSFGSFTSAPGGSLASGPGENRTRVGFGGGVLAEWTVGPRLSVTGTLRYEESVAGLRHEVGQYFNGARGYGIWSDEALLLRKLTLGPALRVGIAGGFGVVILPQLSYLLQARRRFDVGLGGLAVTSAGTRSQAVIFEQASWTYEQEVTSGYDRVLAGLFAGLSFEHPVAGQRLRVEAGYGRTLGDPARSGAGEGSLQELRAGIAWLH